MADEQNETPQEPTGPPIFCLRLSKKRDGMKPSDVGMSADDARRMRRAVDAAAEDVRDKVVELIREHGAMSAAGALFSALGETGAVLIYQMRQQTHGGGMTNAEAGEIGHSIARAIHAAFVGALQKHGMPVHGVDLSTVSPVNPQDN